METTLTTSIQDLDRAIRQCNLRTAWRLMKTQSQWTAGDCEQVRALAFQEWGPEWRTEIEKA